MCFTNVDEGSRQKSVAKGDKAERVGGCLIKHKLFSCLCTIDTNYLFVCFFFYWGVGGGGVMLPVCKVYTVQLHKKMLKRLTPNYGFSLDLV